MKNKKETRGGKRPFSGRKKADYETKTIAFRVRVELVEPIIIKAAYLPKMSKQSS